MGFLSEKLIASFGDHTIEVEGRNDILRGLIYTLSLDGEELAEAQNLLKLPTHKTLEARAMVDGIERHFIVEVKQSMLNTDYALTIDGASQPLERVN